MKIVIIEKDILYSLLEEAFGRRAAALESDTRKRGALRLFNGFTEGCRELAIDLLGKTVVIQDYSPTSKSWDFLPDFIVEKLPFVQAVVLKKRCAENPQARNGVIVYGEKVDTFVEEHAVRYAVDLTMNHDNGFYSDTRFLRKYLLENMRGKTLLNTFAYTGSLGVAAAAGGAEFVLQTDLSNKFMSQSYRSASLNGFAFTRKNFRCGDFFPVTASLRKAGALFDCVIVDPPFFSTTNGGVVDLAKNPLNVINKVRPLVADNGILIAVNNSLYLSGKDFLEAINSISRDGYLQFETAIPIPGDFCCCTGNTQTLYPADPAPFNHPTKIAVLRVRRR